MIVLKTYLVTCFYILFLGVLYRVIHLDGKYILLRALECRSAGLFRPKSFGSFGCSQGISVTLSVVLYSTDIPAYSDTLGTKLKSFSNHPILVESCVQEHIDSILR